MHNTLCGVGVVAIGGISDDLIARSNGEQDLCCTWRERYDTSHRMIQFDNAPQVVDHALGSLTWKGRDKPHDEEDLYKN